MIYENSISFAKRLDQSDPLNKFRNKFNIPEEGGKQMIYFAGNSLGLMPITSKAFVMRELEVWGGNGRIRAA